MKKISHGALLAVAALAAIPASVGIAKTYERMGWHHMSPETRMRLDEGRIAMVKAALKMSPDQEKLWAPLEAQARDALKTRSEKREQREKMREQFEKERADGKRPDMAERLDRMSQNLTERADKMKAFASTFRPFYASLSDEQKDVLRPLMRSLAPGLGDRGHHGPRHAWFGGWGPHGWNHGSDHHGPGHHEDGQGGGRSGSPDATPQHGPGFEDDTPVPSDKL